MIFKFTAETSWRTSIFTSHSVSMQISLTISKWSCFHSLKLSKCSSNNQETSTRSHFSPETKTQEQRYIFWPIGLDLPCPLWLTSRVAMTLLKTATSGSFSPMTRDGMRGDMISCLWRMYVSMAILDKEIPRGKGPNWRKKGYKNIA